MEPVRVLGSLHVCFSRVAGCSSETPNRGGGVGSLTLLLALGTFFLLLGSLMQPRCEGLCLVLLCLVGPCSFAVLRRPALL